MNAFKSGHYYLIDGKLHIFCGDGIKMIMNDANDDVQSVSAHLFREPDSMLLVGFCDSECDDVVEDTSHAGKHVFTTAQFLISWSDDALQFMRNK